MDNSTPEHDQPAASAETAGPGGNQAPWRISFVIPEMDLRTIAPQAIRNHVRAVTKEALKQTGQSAQDNVLGLRIHVQFKFPPAWDEQAIADARQGRILPPVSTMYISRICAGALKNVLFHIEEQVLQMLVTTAWGDTDALQLSAWELDLGRREGVQ